MARTPSERKDISFSVKLRPEDMEYLQKMQKERSANATAEVIRDILAAMRTTFALPQYMADRIQEDMKERGLPMLEYLKELLGMRYEMLKSGDAEAPPPTKSKR